jgi:hypothetical protein
LPRGSSESTYKFWMMGDGHANARGSGDLEMLFLSLMVLAGCARPTWACPTMSRPPLLRLEAFGAEDVPAFIPACRELHRWHRLEYRAVHHIS